MSTVAILRTSPATVIADYHRLLNLAGYVDVVTKNAETALKVNISWHFPGSSTTPWQLDGVIRAMRADGYDLSRVHACHSRTVVIDAHLGERETNRSMSSRRIGCGMCTSTKATSLGSTSATPSATSPSASCA